MSTECPKVMSEASFYGREPIDLDATNQVALSKALDWYTHFKETDDARKYLAAYIGAPLDCPDNAIDRTFGWLARIAFNGNTLLPKHQQKLDAYVRAVTRKRVTSKAKANANTDSPYERMARGVFDVLGDVDAAIESFIFGGFKPIKFDMAKWLRKQEFAANHVAVVLKKLTAHVAEVDEVIAGTDEDLCEAYSCYSTRKVKKLREFLQTLIDACGEEKSAIRVRKPRKPRAAKVKSAAKITAKVNYKASDTKLGIVSFDPKKILGANQVWLFNTKYRTLTVLRSEKGLSIKGTTIQGFDEKTSECKRLRDKVLKNTLKSVTTCGKVELRKLMGTIKTRPAKVTGRMGAETLILRVI